MRCWFHLLFQVISYLFLCPASLWLCCLRRGRHFHLLRHPHNVKYSVLNEWVIREHRLTLIEKSNLWTRVVDYVRRWMVHTNVSVIGRVNKLKHQSTIKVSITSHLFQCKRARKVHKTWNILYSKINTAKSHMERPTRLFYYRGMNILVFLSSFLFHSMGFSFLKNEAFKYLL